MNDSKTTDIRQPAPLPTAGPVPFNALRGLWNLTWRPKVKGRSLIQSVLPLLMVPILSYLTIDPGDERDYYPWVFNFYFKMIVPIVCLAACGSMIRDEIQADTMGFLSTRPIKRAWLYIGKYLCQTLWLQLYLGFFAAVMIAVGILKGVESVGPMIPYLILAQAFAICAWGSLSALLGLFSKNYFAIAIVYSFIVEFGIGRIPTNINNLSIARHLHTLLGQNESLQRFFEWDLGHPVTAVLFICLGTGIYLAAGAFYFTWKEFLSSDDAQR